MPSGDNKHIWGYLWSIDFLGRSGTKKHLSRDRIFRPMTKRLMEQLGGTLFKCPAFIKMLYAYVSHHVIHILP